MPNVNAGFHLRCDTGTVVLRLFPLFFGTGLGQNNTQFEFPEVRLPTSKLSHVSIKQVAAGVVFDCMFEFFIFVCEQSKDESAPQRKRKFVHLQQGEQT